VTHLHIKFIDGETRTFYGDVVQNLSNILPWFQSAASNDVYAFQMPNGQTLHIQKSSIAYLILE